jgi:hypothetical protein
MRTEYFRALASGLIVAGSVAATVSGIAKDTPDFVRITPALEDASVYA